MKLNQAVARACEEPSLVEALTFISLWECERAIQQALAQKLTGISTAAEGDFDTCFRSCFTALMEAWDLKMTKKPPLGVAPRWFHQEHRLGELCEAVLRYRQEAVSIPDEWLEEIRDLSDQILVRSQTRARMKP